MIEKPRVVAGIPAYNEEKTIAKVILRASRHVDKVVVVDDGSSDDTALIAESLGAVLLRHDRNMGKGVAIRACLDWARQMGAKVLVTLDGDAQHDPDDIPRIIQPILEGKADIVIGCRARKPPSMPRLRRFAQRFLDHLTRVKARENFVDSQSGFRAYSRSAIDAIQLTEPGIGAEVEILRDARSKGLSITEVPVVMYYGLGHRTSKINPLIQFSDVLSTLAKNVIGRRPMRFIGIPGLALIAYGIYGWLGIFSTYNLTREFATGHALVYTIILLAGIFLTTAAIVLFMVRMMIQEIHGK